MRRGRASRSVAEPLYRRRFLECFCALTTGWSYQTLPALQIVLDPTARQPPTSWPAPPLSGDVSVSLSEHPHWMYECWRRDSCQRKTHAASCSCPWRTAPPRQALRPAKSMSNSSLVFSMRCRVAGSYSSLGSKTQTGRAKVPGRWANGARTRSSKRCLAYTPSTGISGNCGGVANPALSSAL